MPCCAGYLFKAYFITFFILSLHLYLKNFGFLLGFSNGQSIQGVSPGTGGELLQKIGIGGLTLDKKVLDEMDQIRDLVTSMRSLKASGEICPTTGILLFLFSPMILKQMFFEK